MKFSRYFAAVKRFIFRHKIIAGIILLALLYGGYRVYAAATAPTTGTRYYTAAVTRGTIITSITGVGQVSASNQVNVTPRASGDIISLPIVAGQSVAAGQVLAQLDTTTAEKAVRDAQSNLESAQLSLDKLKQSSADIGQLTDAAFADISNAFLDLPDIVSAAEDVILSDSINPRNQDNWAYYQDFVRYDDAVNYQKATLFVNSALDDYRTARTAYDATFIEYKNASRYSDQATVQDLLDKTTETVKSLAQALKSEQNVLDFLSDYGATYNKSLPQIVLGYRTSLRTSIGQVNSDLSSLVSAQNAIENAPLDIKSQELTVQQRQNALDDAKSNLADYTVRAPFAGVITDVPVSLGDSASSGSTIATLITHTRLAEITLNEVDAAKVKAGQKATLTFDAIPDLSVSGEVASVDIVGTVSQGVVSYAVKVSFDTQDSRVKPGMSVSAAIVTDVKQNVLQVPNSAIKTTNGTSYVEVFDAGSVPASAGTQGFISAIPPRQQVVETGVSNDTATEIVSGLTEGQEVVVRTVTGQVTTQTQSAPSLFGGGGGGGGVRFRAD